MFNNNSYVCLPEGNFPTFGLRLNWRERSCGGHRWRRLWDFLCGTPVELRPVSCVTNRSKEKSLETCGKIIGKSPRIRFNWDFITEMGGFASLFFQAAERNMEGVSLQIPIASSVVGTLDRGVALGKPTGKQ